MKALGVDVSAARQLDLVAMEMDGTIVFGPAKVGEDSLAAVIRDIEPDVIAIDSPPEWAPTGKSRPIENQLARMGIHAFPTPALGHRRPLHKWMEAGFRVFEIAKSSGYPLYRGNTDRLRQAIEVFPHASAIVLRGGLPGRGVAKQVWRRRTLIDAGIDTSALTSEDELDAALAALTGVRFIEGRTCEVGQAGLLVLVLPVDELPLRSYLREAGLVRAASISAPALAGTRKCECGCGAPVRRRYLPGHDAKHRSLLRKGVLT